MFKKKTKETNKLFYLSIPPSRKKAFETMQELLRDAEKYDRQSEIELSCLILTDLIKYIEIYKKKKLDITI